MIGIKHKPGGGWVCLIKGCRFDREGYNDAETHASTEHPELELEFKRDTMHFYITATVSMLQKEGVL